MNTNSVPNTRPQEFDRAGSPIHTIPVAYSSRAIREVAQKYEDHVRQNQATQAALEALQGIKSLNLDSPQPHK